MFIKITGADGYTLWTNTAYVIDVVQPSAAQQAEAPRDPRLVFNLTGGHPALALYEPAEVAQAVAQLDALTPPPVPPFLLLAGDVWRLDAIDSVAFHYDEQYLASLDGHEADPAEAHGGVARFRDGRERWLGTGEIASEFWAALQPLTQPATRSGSAPTSTSHITHADQDRAAVERVTP